MLLTGLGRGELTVLLWGGAFGFAALYPATVSFLVRWRLGRSTPTGVLSVQEGGLVFCTDERPPAAALLGWSAVFEGRHSPGRRWSARAPLGLVTTVEGPARRGVYQTTVRWELTDWFGFVRWSPAARWEAAVTVPAVARPWRPALRPESRRGPIRSRRTGQRAGDPFDVRRYAPGDDLRRLHWPLFAHAGQLFVRTADPSPPPEGRWLLTLDTTAPDEEALDDRLALVAGWLEKVSRAGGTWTLSLAGGPALRSEDGGLDRFLAALSPTAFDLAAATLPPGARLITGEHTPAARSSLPLVLVPEPTPQPRVSQPWWSRR